jgi:anthranilate synthase/aminodeoxychorismate synthase-like glutamine amidotransferase
MKVLIIDNYDSFTYNLVQYVGELGDSPVVVRNDRITIDEVIDMDPDSMIISPGPGEPKDAGISCELIRQFTGKFPILGVCLGHQCIAHAFGGKVTRAETLMHGKTSKVYHMNEDVFGGLPSPFEATRYHSLIVHDNPLPDRLRVIAHTIDGDVMGIKLENHPVFGVQFHPESILTRYGKKFLTNFLNLR